MLAFWSVGPQAMAKYLKYFAFSGIREGRRAGREPWGRRASDLFSLIEYTICAGFAKSASRGIEPTRDFSRRFSCEWFRARPLRHGRGCGSGWSEADYTFALVGLYLAEKKCRHRGSNPRRSDFECQVLYH